MGREEPQHLSAGEHSGQSYIDANSLIPPKYTVQAIVQQHLKLQKFSKWWLKDKSQKLFTSQSSSTLHDLQTAMKRRKEYLYLLGFHDAIVSQHFGIYYSILSFLQHCDESEYGEVK